MKKVHHDMFLHKSAVNDFPEPHRRMVKLALKLSGAQDFDVICISSQANPESDYGVRFVTVDDFDNNPEPAILRQRTYRIGCNEAILVKDRVSKNGNPQIYHGTELLVGKDYYGFDTAAAERRRETYLKLNPDRRRMGYQRYWLEWAKENKI